MLSSDKHPSKDITGTWSEVLRSKKIALCICGSVACYLAPEIARNLMRHGAEVIPVMTKDATKLIGPELMEWATGNEAIVELTGKLEHVKLGGETMDAVNLVLVAPATANTIAKISAGIADNAVTTLIQTAIGAGIPIMIAPVMHEPLFRNPIIYEAIESLKSRGIKIIEPRIEEGKAKIQSPETICEYVIRELYPRKFPKGVRVLITTGATVEFIDPIRVITNLSSGRMGFSIARECFRRGCETEIITGRTAYTPPPHIKSSTINTSEELRNKILEKLEKEKIDVFFSTVAVADYKPSNISDRKIDSRRFRKLTVELSTTQKILPMVKEISPDTVVVGFKAEYNVGDDELIDRAEELLEYSDIVYASDVSKPESYFGSEKTSGVIITREKGMVEKIERKEKEYVASRLLDLVHSIIIQSRKQP